LLIVPCAIRNSNFLEAFVGGGVTIIGSKNLVDDLTTWLMILLSGWQCCSWSIIDKKSASGVIDYKGWYARIVGAIVSCIGDVLVGIIIDTLRFYRVQTD